MDDIDEVLGIYGVMFDDPLAIPYSMDSEEVSLFIEEVKKAIETKTPINKAKWYGDGSVYI